MIAVFPKTSTPTRRYTLSPEEARLRRFREQYRRELPALRQQSQEGIAALQRLVDRAGR